MTKIEITGDCVAQHTGHNHVWLLDDSTTPMSNSMMQRLVFPTTTLLIAPSCSINHPRPRRAHRTLVEETDHGDDISFLLPLVLCLVDGVSLGLPMRPGMLIGVWSLTTYTHRGGRLALAGGLVFSQRLWRIITNLARKTIMVI